MTADAYGFVLVLIFGAVLAGIVAALLIEAFGAERVARWLHLPPGDYR